MNHAIWADHWLLILAMNICRMIFVEVFQIRIMYSHLLSNKRGGWNKCGGGAKNGKSLNVEGVININFWARVKFYSSKWLRKIVIRFCNNIRHFSNEINKRGGGIFFWGGWNFSKLVSVGSTFIREMRVNIYIGKIFFQKNTFFSWPIRVGILSYSAA